MTDPDPDAAKLLPCPFPWRGDDGTSKQCIERGHCGCDENTRPQPASLLAARPKVDGADVRKIAKDLREAADVIDNGVTKILDAEFFVKAADLLERLAEEVAQYKRAECCHFENIAELATTLAEREAELAKADAVVADYAFGKDIVGGAPFPGTVMEFSKAELDAMSRHTARKGR